MFISSTGGHLDELLRLKPLFEKYDSYLVTEKTESNISLKSKYKNLSFLIYGISKRFLQNPLTALCQTN